MKLLSTSTVLGLACVMLMTAGCNLLPEKGYSGPKFLDARDASRLDTVHLESNDLLTACNGVVSKILANPKLANPSYPPRYVVDPAHFTYQGRSHFNVHALTDLLRTELADAGAGRVVLLGLPLAEEDEEEAAPELPDAEYLITGRITSVDNISRARQENYLQLAFEVVDIASRRVVLSDRYHVKKAGHVGREWKYAY